jgi:hypothetical protein
MGAAMLGGQLRDTAALALSVSGPGLAALLFAWREGSASAWFRSLRPYPPHPAIALIENRSWER